jgi:hypothetical protein
MTVYTCENCGSVASTLAGCPRCGAAFGSVGQAGIVQKGARAILPFLLGVFGLCLTIPAGMKAVHSYNERVEQNQIRSDSLLRVESDRQREEERRMMVARADSVINTIPRSRITRLSSDQLNSDIVIVGWRSDPLARRWMSAATRELQARSAKTAKRGRSN